VSLKIDIQNKVVAAVEAGTFTKIVYSGKTASEAGTIAPQSVVCNEAPTGATVSNSVRFGATNSGSVLTSWRFECIARFTSEVDSSYFLMNELETMYLTSDGVLATIIPDSQPIQPPRQASHNGTKLTIGLTVNTRR
jgi:hypothetical protein